MMDHEEVTFIAVNLLTDNIVPVTAEMLCCSAQHQKYLTVVCYAQMFFFFNPLTTVSAGNLYFVISLSYHKN